MKHGCELGKAIHFSDSQILFGNRLTRETQFRIKFIASIFKSGKVERKNHKQLVFLKVIKTMFPGHCVPKLQFANEGKFF